MKNNVYTEQQHRNKDLSEKRGKTNLSQLGGQDLDPSNYGLSQA